VSIKVIQWVWDCSSSKNAERLVLLAIADNAADDGSHAYPSVAEISRKANLSERGVQAAIARLVKSGELTVHVGGGRGRTNYYTVIMKPCHRNTPQDVHPSSPGAGGETPQNSTETPQDAAENPADSAPGTVSEPSKEPSSSSDADASPTAQTIMKGFIDWLAARPEPVKLTPSVIARYGKAIKALLQANYDVNTIKMALALQTERGKAGWPSMLDSFCVEVQNRPVSGPPAAPRTFKQMDADDQERQRRIVLAMQMIMDQNPATEVSQARSVVMALVERGELDLNALSTSAATGYIDGVVITEDAKEVTGS
jgi:hypothetical protein